MQPIFTHDAATVKPGPDQAAGAPHAGSNRLTVLAADIVAAHNDVLAFEAKATERAIGAGKLLIEAKDSLKHGQWLPWLKANFAFSERTAQRYIRLAEAAANPTRCRILEMGVAEALRYLDEVASIPLPKPTEVTIGLVGNGEASIAYIVHDRDADDDKSSYHIAAIDDGHLTVCTTRRPVPGDLVYESLRAVEFPVALAKWKVEDADWWRKFFAVLTWENERRAAEDAEAR